jgi:Putative antitoxin
MCIVHGMGTKTISLKDEAYARLRAARRYPAESFSEVVLRATWPEDTATAGTFLRMIRQRRVHFTDDEIVRIEELKRTDGPPEDKWGAR